MEVFFRRSIRRKLAASDLETGTNRNLMNSVITLVQQKWV